jgi:hypothetical protein
MDAEKAYEDRIMWGVSKGAILKAKAKVAAWQKYEAADQAFSSSVSDLQQAAQPEPELLGPQPGTTQEISDEEDRVREAFRKKHGRDPYQEDADELEALANSMNAGG